MDEKTIRKYAGLMRELGLTGMEFRENGSLARLERTAGASQPGADGSGLEAAAAQTGLELAESRLSGTFAEVTSPMVGVFYCAPAEYAQPFVRLGQQVHKGDVLCIIEAMKLMNELVADESGIVEEICAENGQVVDFGRVLFRLRKDT